MHVSCLSLRFVECPFLHTHQIQQKNIEINQLFVQFFVSMDGFANIKTNIAKR